MTGVDTLATLADILAPPGAGPLADDTGFVTVRFENGMLGHFTHCAVSAYPHTRMEIHGDEGALLAPRSALLS